MATERDSLSLAHTGSDRDGPPASPGHCQVGPYYGTATVGPAARPGGHAGCSPDSPATGPRPGGPRGGPPDARIMIIIELRVRGAAGPVAGLSHGATQSGTDGQRLAAAAERFL
jgi:hypothetical protein